MYVCMYVVLCTRGAEQCHGVGGVCVCVVLWLSDVWCCVCVCVCDCDVLTCLHVVLWQDYCKDCHIVTGPVASSVFIRNCQDCVVVVACQQLRLRDCKNLSESSAPPAVLSPITCIVIVM